MRPALRWRWALAAPAVIAALASCGAPATPATASALGLRAGTTGEPADGDNLVANPSFEEGTGARASGWRSNEAFAATAVAARTGSRGMELRDSDAARWTPALIQELDLEPGRYTLRGWVRAEGAGVKRRGSGGRISLGRSLSTRVVRGTTAWTQLEATGEIEGGPTRLKLEAFNKPDGVLHFDDIEVVRHAPTPLVAFLLYPNYRGDLFADAPQQVRLRLTVGRPEAGAVARVEIEDETGRRLPAVTVPAAEPEVDAAFDASGLETGAYRVLVSLVAPSGEERFRHPPLELVKLPASAREAMGVYVDSDNALRVGGHRIFPLGIYDTSGYSASPRFWDRRLEQIAEAPLNVYINYWISAAPIESLRALLASLDGRDMFYLHTINTWYEDNDYWPADVVCGGRPAAELGERGFTECMARELSDEPRLAGWYTADERPLDEVGAVRRQYAALRSGHSGGVTFIAQNRPHELTAWRDAADVIGVDPYPIHGVAEGELASLELVADWVESADRAVHGARPVWAVLQYFPFGSPARWPTRAELRSMSLMAVASGADGLLYWSYGAKGLAWVKDEDRRAEIWQRLVDVTREIGALEPVLLGEAAPEDLRSVEPADAVRTAVRRVRGETWVIAASVAAAPTTVRFESPRDLSAVEVSGEDRAIPAREGSFQDAFGPYEAHVYRLVSDSPAK